MVPPRFFLGETSCAILTRNLLPCLNFGATVDNNFLKELEIQNLNAGASTGTQWIQSKGGHLDSLSPVDGHKIASVQKATAHEYDQILASAEKAFKEWRTWPAPQRGLVVREMGEGFRQYKKELGSLISYEMGKSLQEGWGEVQEMIDICDFALGLSRQLYGITMPSERRQHRMYEQWHPLGLVGVITSFNFPAAVWAWNAAIATVCGDVSIWKPSPKTPLSAIACMKIAAHALAKHKVPEGVLNLLIGDLDPIGKSLVDDKRVALISATGSTAMGKRVSELVGKRLGKTLLELGGNNAVIVSEKADLARALPSLVFGAVGTAGQRCTSLRRLIVHRQIYEKVKQSLLGAYKSLRVGDPLDEKNHMGPLIDTEAVDKMQKALHQIKEQGGQVLFGGQSLMGESFSSGCYVMPALVEAQSDMPIVQEETFAPILYLLSYEGDVTEAIKIQNSVAQGLSSAIFTEDLRESEIFLSAGGSDCGLANVNIGTSGAEIGGAFGGEKESGGGRESGSDAWKAYMRRQTNTIHYGVDLPLAQGIRFELA